MQLLPTSFRTIGDGPWGQGSGWDGRTIHVPSWNRIYHRRVHVELRVLVRVLCEYGVPGDRSPVDLRRSDVASRLSPWRKV